MLSAQRLAPAGRFIRAHYIALILAAAAIVALALFRHHASQAARDSERGAGNAPVAVAVATATTGDIQVRIPALGTVTPLATVTVKTQISGQLQKIAFEEGQLVREGDLLAVVDPRPYEAALKQVQASLARDQALLTNAQLDLQRYQGLFAEDSIAEQQLATQQALVRQYTGTVEGDRAEVSSAALNLQYTRVVSPVAGRVGLRQVDQGNYVTANDANGIVVVTQLQPISALFSIPEDNVAAVMRRLHDGAVLQVEAYDRGNAVKLADGKLLSVDNQIDPATGTFKLRAIFDNDVSDGKAGLLFPNQFVNVRLLISELRNQVIVPNAAVQRGAPNGVASTFVYLVNADSTVTVRPVVLGAVDAERVAVAKGLAAGDVVVTAGGDRLRDGAQVLLPGALPQPSSATHPAKRGARRRHS